MCHDDLLKYYSDFQAEKICIVHSEMDEKIGIIFLNAPPKIELYLSNFIGALHFIPFLFFISLLITFPIC